MFVLAFRAVPALVFHSLLGLLKSLDIIITREIFSTTELQIRQSYLYRGVVFRNDLFASRSYPQRRAQDRTS